MKNWVEYVIEGKEENQKNLYTSLLKKAHTKNIKIVWVKMDEKSPKNYMKKKY